MGAGAGLREKMGHAARRQVGEEEAPRVAARQTQEGVVGSVLAREVEGR